MAKWAHSDVLDGGLNAIKNNVNKQVLLKAYTAGDTYATVNAINNIGEVAMAGGDYTLSSSGSNRLVTTAAGKSATASANSGASPDLHIAFVDTVNSKVLWVTDETTNQVVTAGNTVNFPSVTYTSNQPA